MLVVDTEEDTAYRKYIRNLKEYLEVYRLNRYPIKDSNPINKRVIDYLYEVKDKHNFGRW